MDLVLFKLGVLFGCCEQDNSSSAVNFLGYLESFFWWETEDFL